MSAFKAAHYLEIQAISSDDHSGQPYCVKQWKFCNLIALPCLIPNYSSGLDGYRIIHVKTVYALVYGYV